MKNEGRSVKRRKECQEQNARECVKRYDRDGKPTPVELHALTACLLASLRDVEDLTGFNLGPEKQVVIDRVAQEGMGFLAKRMPEYSDWVLRSIAAKRLQKPLPRFRHGKSPDRPAFLQKLLNELFC